MPTRIREPYPEGSDGILTAILVDPHGAPVGSALVSSIKATLRDVENSSLLFEDREVFNANGGTLDDAGRFELELTAQDMAAVGPIEYQRRLLTLKVTHSGGKKRNQEIAFSLDNMQDAP